MGVITGRDGALEITVTCRWHSAYLYPDTESIQTGLRGTAYEAWTEVFPRLAQMGIKAHYNGLMVESNREFTGIAEYMGKGTPLPSTG